MFLPVSLVLASTLAAGLLPQVLWHNDAPYFVTLDALRGPSHSEEIAAQHLHRARESLRQKLDERRSNDRDCETPIIGCVIGTGESFADAVRRSTAFVGTVERVEPGLSLSRNQVTSLVVISIREEISDPRSEIWPGDQVVVLRTGGEATVDGVRLCTGFDRIYRPQVGDRVLVVGRRDTDPRNLGHFQGALHPVKNGIVDVTEAMSGSRARSVPLEELRKLTARVP